MNNKKGSTVTIYDIASKASVSAATVSKVMNNKGNISEETRNLIFNIAKECGYAPNVAARYLKTMKTNQIMILLPNVSDPFFLDLINEVQSITKEHDYILTINSTDNDQKEELRVLSNLSNQFIDGLIMIALDYTKEHYDILKKINMPVVLCTIGSGAVDHYETICDYVGVDAKKGIYMAVKHLIEQGHRQIGYAGLMVDHHTGHERYQGFVSAMSEFDCPIIQDYIFTGKPLENFGYKVAKAYTKMEAPPTAVCAASDIIIIGMYKAFEESAVRIPDDIAVIGMDDISLADMLKPSISSVNLAQGQIGKECAEMLYKRINGDKSMYKSIVLQPKLVVRNSSVKQTD